MSDHLRLADLYEHADAPDRALEIEVWRLNGGTCRPGHKPLDWLHCTMSSVDAALALVDAVDMADVLGEAQRRLSFRFHLHISRWPEALDYRQHLARFVTAAALRRMYARKRKETGEDFDLRHYEFEGETKLEGDLAYRIDIYPEGIAENTPAVARMWTAVAISLLRRKLVSKPLPAATQAMIEAGEAAYDRKAEDMASPTPTEHPDDGGGPIGYAFRAMVAAMPARQAA